MIRTLCIRTVVLLVLSAGLGGCLSKPELANVAANTSPGDTGGNGGSAGGQVMPFPGGMDTTAPAYTPPSGSENGLVDLTKPLPSAGDGFTATRDRRWIPIYFAYNQSFIGETEREKLSKLGDYLVQNKRYQVVVEGNADERGSEEYNRALGERRALSVKEYLVNLGVDAGRVRTLSYGEDRPADTGHTEAAYAKNRRAEFVILLPKE